MLDIGQQAKEGGQSQHAQSVTQSLLLERICCSSTEQPAKIKHELKPCPGVFRQLFKSYIYTKQQVGHLDFFPNGGEEMPGCRKNALSQIIDLDGIWAGKG